MKKINLKGFTLIELLVTIVLLGVITSISFVSINAIIKKNKINNYNTTIEQIKMAAKQYASDNRYKTIDENVTVEYLKNNGYIKLNEDTIKNPETNEEVNINTIYVNTTNFSITGITVKE